MVRQCPAPGVKHQPLLSELGFVPVGIADDQIAGLCLCGRRPNRGHEVRDRARRRQVDARTAALIMEMAVSKARRDEAAAEIDDFRVRPDAGAYRCGRPTAMNLPSLTAKDCVNGAPTRAMNTLPLTATRSAVWPSAAVAAKAYTNGGKGRGPLAHYVLLSSGRQWRRGQRNVDLAHEVSPC
jgi:hypothetical protein